MSETPKTNTTQPVGSSSNYPPRQTQVIGYHDATTFGGDLLGGHIAQVVQQSPKIGNHILNDLSGIMANTNLAYRDLAIATISTLTAMGDCSDQLAVYVQGALRNGVDVDEITDLFQHAQGFVGNPRAINALRAAWPLLSKARDSNLPESYTESLLRLGDHDTMVRDTHGPGVPIILIHALCLDSRMYKLILPLLSHTTNARIIAYDLRGHGQARGAPLTTSVSHLCTDLTLLMDTLSIPQADIYGTSYGGRVAQLFALSNPSRVRSISPIASSCTANPTAITRATRAEAHGVRSLLPETLIRWFHPETIAANPWCVRYARGCIERARVEEWAAAWRAMSEFDVRDRLAELRVPVMALSGTQDASATPEVMKAIVDACTGAEAELVAVDRGTHMMVIEAPGEVAEKLAAFRKRVDGMERS